MGISVKEQQFDLYSQFALDSRLILSDPGSAEGSPVNQHVTIEGVRTTSYYNPVYLNPNYYSLRYCLREDMVPIGDIDCFLADGASTTNPFLTFSFPGTTYIEEIHIYPYANKGFTTNGNVLMSYNAIDWKLKGTYAGVGKTNVNNYDVIKIREYCNYIRIQATGLQSTKMEMKLVKIFKDRKITLVPTQIGIEQKNSLIMNTLNLQSNPDLKIQGNIHLNVTGAVTSSSILAHDYIEPPFGTPSSNYSTGLHFTELNAEILTVEPKDIHNQQEFDDLINDAKTITKKPINSLSLTSESVIQSLTPTQVDKNAGNIAVRITGNIKIEEEKDFFFWPYCPDNMQLKINGDVITSRYGKAIQHYSSSYPNTLTNMNWNNNLNTIQSIPDQTRTDLNAIQCIVPSPFVEGEFFTYWGRYNIASADGYANRWYNVVLKKTKDFKNFYEQSSIMFTSTIRTQSTWYNNNQQNPYHVYYPKIYWIKEYQKFIAFISVYNNTSTTPGDYGWNIGSMESIDGVTWINPRLVVANEGSGNHLYTYAFALGRSSDKWFILYQKQSGSSPYNYAIDRSETMNLFGDYTVWSTTTEVIPHNDSANISIHTNGANVIGLIENAPESAYRYTVIYRVSSGSTDSDRVIKYSVTAQTNDGIIFDQKTVLSEDVNYQNPPNLVSYPMNVLRRLGGDGDSDRISYEGRTDITYSTSRINNSFKCNYGKYAGKIVSTCLFSPPGTYSDKWNFQNGAGILVHDTYDNLSNAEFVGNFFTSVLWAYDRYVYPNEIKKVGDEYQIHAWMYNGNYYDVSPKYRYMEYIMKSKNLRDVYDHDLYLCGWMYRPSTGEANPTGSYGYDSYSVREKKIVKKSDTEYHMFYVADRSESDGTDRIYHCFSTDGENWDWASVMINTSTHTYFSGGSIGPINFVWDEDTSKWYGSVASYYHSTYSSADYRIVLMQCSGDPHVLANWGSFTELSPPSGMQYWHHVMFKSNGIFHLIAHGTYIQGLVQRRYATDNWTGSYSESLVTTYTSSESGTCSYYWVGYVRCVNAGTYTFYTTSNDGSYLYIDGSLIVNNGGDHGSQERSGTIYFSANSWHRIEMYYYNHPSGGNFSCAWTPAGGSKTANFSGYAYITRDHGCGVHHYSTNFSTWYGASNYTTYMNTFYIFSPSLFSSGYTSRSAIDQDEWKYMVVGYDGSTYPVSFIPQAPDVSRLGMVHLAAGIYPFELIQRNEKNIQSIFSKEMFLECKWSQIGKNFGLVSGSKSTKSACVYELVQDTIDQNWTLDNTRSWFTESPSVNRSSTQVFPDSGIIYAEQGYVYIYDGKNRNIWMKFLIEPSYSTALFRAYVSQLDYSNAVIYALIFTDPYMTSSASTIYGINFITERTTFFRIFSSYTEYIYNGNILNRNARSSYVSQTNGNQRYFGFVTTSSPSANFVNYMRSENVYLYKNIANKAWVATCSGTDSGTKGSSACLSGDPSSEGYTYHTSGGNITITLPYIQSFNKIFTYFYNADSRTFNSFVISGSNDGLSFTTIVNHSSSGYVNVIKDNISTAVYKFIKIAGTGSTTNTNTILNQIDLYELEKSLTQILLICHNEGISYINETNRNYRHIIAKDYLGNIMQCKKAMIYSDTLYAWFTDNKNRIDCIFIKDAFGSEIDLDFVWNSSLGKYVFDLTTTSEFILRADEMIDFDLYDDETSNYVYVTNKSGVLKYKEDRNTPSIINLELIQ